MIARAKVIIGLLIIFATFIFFTMGQAGVTGKIAGKLTDRETGNPLPGGNVVVRGMIQNGQEVQFGVDKIKGAATDLNGEFFILNLPPGIYVVEASYMGYDKQVRKDVKVSVDYTTRVDFQ
ncbi:carboxypeptidase-like regulatory domain-containing protein, partial [candidate division KSB1 bacterium]|nr:carboxypeptidase-like regulatory domain-containing protein [candidate division KSB1 bacterium]